jgi:hypothetical protein
MRAVKDFFKQKGFSYENGQFEKIVGSKVFSIKKQQDNQYELFIWDSKDNRVITKTFEMKVS